MNYIIRNGTVDDAEGKGYVHYKSWIETYTGLFPEEKMKNVTLERSITTAKEHPENTLVAEVDHRVVGFACYIESRDDDLQDTGEIMAIYVLKQYQGLGIGTALLQKCYIELAAYKMLSLWVLGSNEQAALFYQSQGFVFDGSTKQIYDRDVLRMVKPHTTIQRANVNDIPFLQTMLYEAVYWRENPQKPSLKEAMTLPGVQEAIIDFGERDIDVAFVANIANQPIGAVWTRYYTQSHSIRGYISDDIPVVVIAVEKLYRHKSIGTQLLQTILAYHLEHHTHPISLCVSKDNIALGLYQKTGFSIHQDIGDSYIMINPSTK